MLGYAQLASEGLKAATGGTSSATANTGAVNVGGLNVTPYQNTASGVVKIGMIVAVIAGLYFLIKK